MAESETSFFVRDTGRPATFEIEIDETTLIFSGVRAKRIGR